MRTIDDVIKIVRVDFKVSNPSSYNDLSWLAVLLSSVSIYYIDVTLFYRIFQSSSYTCLAVQKILGDTNDVILYNQVHTKLKSSSNKPTKRDEDNYKDILACLQLSVVQKRTIVTESLRQFEYDFYGEHNIVSTNNHQYLKLCRELKYIKKLLRMWKITI